MMVFGKLSIMDEPLIIIFDQLEGLGLEYNKQLLHKFGDAIKELFTYVPNSLIILNLFPDRWKYFEAFFDGSVIDRVSQCQIVLNKPSEEQLKKLLALKAQEQGVDVNKLFTSEDLTDILSQGSIRGMLNRASHYYRFRIQAIPLPATPAKPEAPKSKPSNFEEEVRESLKLILDEIKILHSSSNFSSATDLPVSPAQTVNLPDSSLVIDYLEREKEVLEEEYEKLVIISDSDDIGKLLTVTEAFNTLLKNIAIDRLQLGTRKLPDHLLIKNPNFSVIIGFLQVSDLGFPSRIKNFNELVFNDEEINFMLFRDIRETAITGKVGKTEIDRLNNVHNGQFIYMDKEDRLTFELIYKLIVDIQNRDFAVNLQSAAGIKNLY